MTETARQLLGHTVPHCAWISPVNQSSRSSTVPARPLFPEVVRKWRFPRKVREYFNNNNNIPRGQFPVYPTEAISLSVEDAKTRLYFNVLGPVNAILGAQGAVFRATCPRFLGISDFILCTNNSTVANMPVEMKTHHNLDLTDYEFWEIYRHADRAPIMQTDPNVKFKKRILAQIFGAMACNGLHYGILSNYTDTYFLKRKETEPKTLYISRAFHPNDTNPTLRECVYYISSRAIIDQAGNKLNHVMGDIYSSDSDDCSNPDDNPDDPNDGSGGDYLPSNGDTSDDNSSDGPSKKRKRKQSFPKQTSSKKRAVASSSKGITTIDEYIGGGTYGKVFSGKYHGQDVAWKTCDGFKKEENKETLKAEANIYSILKECQGYVIPRLYYEGYVYGGYLYVLALELIEDARHIDSAVLTIKEKETIVEQLKLIHSYGVLHNDIAHGNILFEPKSHRFFFVDFGLSEFVGTESRKLRKEEKRLKKLLQL